MKKANKWKIMQITIAGLGTIAASAIVGSVAYFFIYKNKDKINNEPIYKSKPILELESNPENDGNDRNIKIDMYKGNSYAQNGPLDQEHLKKLADKINGIRMFGPESYGLKTISINNRNIISDDSDGIYYLGSQEIGLNTKNIEDKIIKAINYIAKKYPYRINKIVKDNIISYDSVIQDLFVEFLYETFYHEYGHHIFTVYTSSPNIQKNNRKSIFTVASGESQIENDWYNKTFLNNFETIFQYNNSKAKKPINIETITLGRGIDAKNYPTVASSYTLKELYENSNKHPLRENDMNVSYAFTTTNNNSSKLKSLLPPYVAIVDDESLKYLYSLSELLTRKMLLSSMAQNDTSISIENGTWIWKIYDFIKNPKDLKALRMSNNTTSDLAKYDKPSMLPGDGVGLNLLKINDDYIKNNYFNDDPFLGYSNKNAKEFMNMIAKSTGQAQGYNLTYIKHFNNYRVQNKNFIGIVNRSDLDKIIFGGYFNESSNHKYIGYKKEEGDSTINEISKIEVNKGYKEEEIGFTFKKKLFSDRENRTSINKNLAYWVTKEYTDANLYANKPLYFYNKNKYGKIIDIVPLKTFRGQVIDEGLPTDEEKIADLASSFLEEDPYLRKYDDVKTWIAKGVDVGKENSSVMIGWVKNNE